MDSSNLELQTKPLLESSTLPEAENRKFFKEDCLKKDAVNSDIATAGPSQGKVLLKLFLHSLAMFLIPFATYSLIRNYVEKEFGMESPKSYIYGAIGAVIVVQFIIASYVYQAFKEEKWENKNKVKFS